LPGNAAAQHEQNAGQYRAVVKRPAPGMAASPPLG
jgi:hypothetical protein